MKSFLQYKVLDKKHASWKIIDLNLMWGKMQSIWLILFCKTYLVLSTKDEGDELDIHTNIDLDSLGNVTRLLGPIFGEIEASHATDKLKKEMKL